MLCFQKLSTKNQARQMIRAANVRATVLLEELHADQDQRMRAEDLVTSLPMNKHLLPPKVKGLDVLQLKLQIEAALAAGMSIVYVS